ncbi:hypothetical protein GCM10023091_25370 [Ravibacter arvi]|uniref:Uncharacterized protein n=1 Tax=Ravibacter arvi TaxID=2051041 RepID=A0ABP8LZE3_9BACT
MNPQFNWRDMLRFDKMIAPTFLTIMYYIHVVVAMLLSLVVIFGGLNAGAYGGPLGMGGGVAVLIGFFSLVVSPFLIRLGYEILIVIFKIHTRLTSIDHQIRQPGAAQPPGPAPFPPVPTAPPAFVSPATPAFPPGGPDDEAPQSTTGFQVPHAVNRPLIPGADPAATEPFLQDFWPPEAASQTSGTTVPPLNVGELKSRMPNWPAAIAALIVLYAVIFPYAQIGFDVPFIGSIQGKAYAIKDTSLGMLAVLSTILMLVAAGGGLKWKIFLGGFGATLLLSLAALFSEGGIFSDISRIKTGIARAGSAAGSGFGQFIPEAERISGQMAANTPGASQFLSLGFYLFVLAMAFLGYWAFTGKYQEKGLMQS